MNKIDMVPSITECTIQQEKGHREGERKFTVACIYVIKREELLSLLRPQGGVTTACRGECMYRGWSARAHRIKLSLIL